MDHGKSGFSYVTRANGEVCVLRNERPVAVLRGATAERFLRDVQRLDPALVMARVTGDYKRGNERLARRHPRNRSR